VSARVYSVFLLLYPTELRNGFGAEMAQVFLEDLEDSYRTRGWIGVARVWWQSLKELCRIALPVEVSKREIAVPLIVYLLQEIYLAGIMLLARGDPRAVVPKSIGQMTAFGIVAGMVPAFIAFVALRVGNRSVPAPLNLSSK
jgi:hypothetical protein